MPAVPLSTPSSTSRTPRCRCCADRLEGADSETVLAIQKEIELTKKAAQRRLLEVQLEMATTAGDQAGIERLQAALAAWDAPIPVGQPVERPVPTNPGR
jgi:hypothetical protein